MKSPVLLHSMGHLAAEFGRCCRDYNTLHVAVAWCGHPKQMLPYGLLKAFQGKVKATIGVAFAQSHPDGIQWFLDTGARVRIFKDEAGIFHPKLYLFHQDGRYALFVGSSNLTYGGFCKNYEINCLIEGTGSKAIASLDGVLTRWRRADFSFVPTPQWLHGYRRRHKKAARRRPSEPPLTPSQFEQERSTADWIWYANWDTYYGAVLNGSTRRQYNVLDYHAVLDAAAKELPLPWKPSYFNDIEKRRIMGGLDRYGLLGHVAASGFVRSLFATGTPKQRATICKAVNAIARLNPPISGHRLNSYLDRLVSLGPTMKVWGRILCLIRPDLYCTVSAGSVRKALADASGIPMSRLAKPVGYAQLIEVIHASLWFTSKPPGDAVQRKIWARRTSLLDAIYY